MTDYQLGAVESRFADIIWREEPLVSAELVKLCENELGWKKSTTYTVLKRLCEKGIFKNERGMVSSSVSRAEFYSMQSEKIVERSFEGSLPAFVAAFCSARKLSAKEAEELRRLVDEYEEK